MTEWITNNNDSFSSYYYYQGTSLVRIRLALGREDGGGASIFVRHDRIAGSHPLRFSKRDLWLINRNRVIFVDESNIPLADPPNTVVGERMYDFSVDLLLPYNEELSIITFSNFHRGHIVRPVNGEGQRLPVYNNRRNNTTIPITIDHLRTIASEYINYDPDNYEICEANSHDQTLALRILKLANVNLPPNR